MALSLRLTEKIGGTPKGGPAPLEKEPILRDEAQDPRRGSTPPQIGNGRKILVVDDNPIVLKAFEIKLKACGFNVVTTGNGAAVARTAEQETPELIILDINFPTGGAMEWSGFTIMQWLRRFPELAKIPVILITGADPTQYQSKAREAGVVALFQKPVDFKQLVSSILQSLNQPPRTVPPPP